jgi:hypothetical protein
MGATMEGKTPGSSEKSACKLETHPVGAVWKKNAFRVGAKVVL